MTTETAGHEDYAGLLEEIWIERTFSIARDHPNTTEALDKAHAAIIKLEQENAKLRDKNKKRNEFMDAYELWSDFGDWNDAAEALRADVKEG